MPTTVVNTTHSTYRVEVFPALLTQDLTGAFNFAETPRNLNSSKLVLSASPDHFLLPPGGVRTVGLDWHLMPIGVRSLAVGVVFQGVAEGQTGSVNVVSRLLSVNFLSLPGAYVVGGRFTRLAGEQFGPGVLRFLARVRNTGNRVWAPARGRFTIRDARGAVRFAVSWPGDVVLPGAQRDFPIDVKRLLPAGRYTATVSMRFARSHSGPTGRQTRSTAFTLVAPNTLPTPAVAVRNFNATGTIGGSATLTGEIASTGSAPVGITLELALSRVDGSAAGRTIAAGTVAYRNLPPGAVRELAERLGRDLPKGAYRATVTWRDPSGTVRMTEAEFTTTRSRSLLDRIGSLITDHATVLIALLGLLLFVFVVAALLRRQRRVEAELHALRAAVSKERPEEPVGPPTRSDG